MCTTEAALGQARELHGLLARLEAAGIEAGVLKGLPFAQQLYGDIGARRSLDFDLYVAAEARAEAHRVLCADGWAHKYGYAPGEGTYLSTRLTFCRALELHSALIDESLLAHIELPPPDWSAVTVEGASMRVPAGPTVPLFLCAHHAKHPTIPLLWWIDLASVAIRSEMLTDPEVDALAERVGLKRCLGWAATGVALMNSIAEGDRATGMLAIQKLRALHRRRNVLRLMTLASGVVDAGRVLANWAWPPELRARPAHYAADSARRLKAVVSRGRAQIRESPTGALP